MKDWIIPMLCTVIIVICYCNKDVEQTEYLAISLITFIISCLYLYERRKK